MSLHMKGGKMNEENESRRTFRSEIGGTRFYPEVSRKPLSECLNKEYEMIDARIVRGYKGKFGISDFALILFREAGSETGFTTLCGGKVVVKKIQQALDEGLLPLYGTITDKGYYDIN